MDELGNGTHLFSCPKKAVPLAAAQELPGQKEIRQGKRSAFTLFPNPAVITPGRHRPWGRPVLYHPIAEHVLGGHQALLNPLLICRTHPLIFRLFPLTSRTEETSHGPPSPWLSSLKPCSHCRNTPCLFGSITGGHEGGHGLVQGLDKHQQFLHNVQGPPRSSPPPQQARSADGAPVPVAKSLHLRTLTTSYWCCCWPWALLVCLLCWSRFLAPPVLSEHSTCSVAADLQMEQE